MWRLFHKLFGWHYCVMQFGYYDKVFRVHKSPNGVLYINAYGSIVFPNGTTRKITPLTWSDKNEHI